MTRLIRHVSIAPRSLSPFEADLLVRVESDADGIELNGRLIGPTCLYATTIEVAYPLRPLPGRDLFGPLTRRVVIPEPSLWSPVTPFLYRGFLELTRHGGTVERLDVVTGLRSLRLTPDGVWWNGKPLKLSSVDRSDLRESDLPALRARGMNALVIDWPNAPLLAEAERVGFAVFGRLNEPGAIAPDSPALLAWLLPDSWRSREAEWLAWLPRAGRYIGAAPDGRELPASVQFIVGGNADAGRPRLI